MIVIDTFKACEREIADLPIEVRHDLADALARLDAGQTLSMPLSRPMPSIGAGVHELRFRDRAGVFRVIYALVIEDFVHVLHAFKKTTRETPKRSIELAQSRLRQVRQQVAKERRQ